MNKFVGTIMMVWATLQNPPSRDERGGQVTIETILLIAGVIVLVAGVLVAIGYYVNAKLPRP